MAAPSSRVAVALDGADRFGAAVGVLTRGGRQAILLLLSAILAGLKTLLIALVSVIEILLDGIVAAIDVFCETASETLKILLTGAPPTAIKSTKTPSITPPPAALPTGWSPEPADVTLQAVEEKASGEESVAPTGACVSE